MDFRSLVNKENFKAILHHSLKRQVQAKFSKIILKDIQVQSENETEFSDNTLSSISSNISQSDEFKKFSKAFLSNVDHLFEDREKYIPKEDSQGTISQCSSASSVNTSIDYISFDQFQDIIHVLCNGVSAEKLEALETFSRLPSLEHIIKQTLWPSVEMGLHSALSSNVILLKEASLRVYTKMLSSSEPKVVQESFNSLIKHVVQNLLPLMNQNDADFVYKCKSVVEIVAILNKFLQNIPNHWLRYPQQVIESITVQSVSILSYGSEHSKIFPVWLCVALCDKKSNWLKSMLYGHISRSYLIDALQKDPHTIKLAIQFCNNFILNNNYFSWNGCCQNSAEITEITHIVCFLAHLLRYSQGREIFTTIHVNVPCPWIEVLNLIMKCTFKLCSVSCFNCCKVACDVLSKMWHHIWPDNDVTQYCDSLLKILLNFDMEDLPKNSMCFVISCLSNIPCDFLLIISTPETENKVLYFTSNLIKYVTNYSVDLPDVLLEESMFLNSCLIYIKKVFSEPSILFFHSSLVFDSLIKKFADLSKLNLSSIGPALKSSSLEGIEQSIFQLVITMLQKPYSLSILYNTELYEASINILLEKILEDIKLKNSVCHRDISILTVALNSIFSSKSILNKSVVFKLSSVIWQFDTSNLQNLPTVKSILETLIPSIFPHLFQSEVLLDENMDESVKFFQYILLFPSLTNPEFFMLEEYILINLQIISLLTSSIFSVCYLEANHKLSDMIFKLQSNRFDQNMYIDALSVIQNHILVKLYTVGGLKERVLPPETLYSNIDEYDWPFIKNYPVPEVYYHALNHDVTDLDNNPVELSDENMKDIFLKYVKQDLVSFNMISHLLKLSLTDTEESPALSRTLNFLTLDNVDNLVLQDEIIMGLKLTRRYGEILNLLKEDDEKTLEKLLIAGKCLLSTENKHDLDLFICTVALIFKCDIHVAWSCLEAFSKCSGSLFIWYERILQAVEQNAKYVTIFSIIMEHCDIVVKQTLPHVYSAFQFTKILPSVLFQYWMKHCYWNYLEFTEISHYVLATVILGEDFAIYFFVSVLKHIQSLILRNAHNFNLVNLLKMTAIDGYKMQNYIAFMHELSHIYRNKISKSVSEIL